MFGLGLPEIAIILVVALVILGPKRLPEAARSLGRSLAEFRRASTEVRNSLMLESAAPERVAPASKSSGPAEAEVTPAPAAPAAASTPGAASTPAAASAPGAASEGASGGSHAESGPGDPLRK